MPSVAKTSFRIRTALLLPVAVALPLALSVLAPAVAAQDVDPALLSGLTYRFIGPDGNRIISVMGEPGEPLVMYAGAASGSLFKTDDGGVRWRPIFDDQEVSSVSALAMAPSDFNQIWAGTGETFLIRPAHAMGDGIVPTVAQREVHQVLTDRLEDAKQAIQPFLDGELNLLNDRLRALGRPAIVSDGEGA